MKAIFRTNYSGTSLFPAFLQYNNFLTGSNAQISTKKSINLHNDTFLSTDLITDETREEMANSRILNLSNVCSALFQSLIKNYSQSTAKQFLQVMNQLESLSNTDIREFFNNSLSNHLLVQNELLKVVLIHWKPGDQTPIHGHNKAACMFKVLHGSVEEKQFTPDDKQKLIAVKKYQKGMVAYIDDSFAHHSVSNPFDKHAITLHAYTPGLNVES